MNWENYKSNGLSNINYDVLYELETNYFESNNYHIIVDLEYLKSKKIFPQDYEITQKYDKHYYKKFINDKIYGIKQIKF